jgi:hypothetical protein
MRIRFKLPQTWNCQACSYGGIPEDEETCDLCEHTGQEIRNWIKEREIVNGLIESYNNNL